MRPGDKYGRQLEPGGRLLVVVRKNDREHWTQATAGLEALAARVQRGHAHIKPDTVSRSVNRLFGKRWAAGYFHWQLVALTPQEQAALPPPGPGCRPPGYRFVFTFDAAAAVADERYDGLSVLFTTAPLHHSGDELFTNPARNP